MENNEEQVQYLKNVAQQMIIKYVESNLKDCDESNVFKEQEIIRIKEIIRKIPIIFEQVKAGNPCRGSNNGRKIKLMFKALNNITLAELNDFIVTVIHEIYHSISKVADKFKNTFLEEGMVTQITAETIRYNIDNYTEIEGISKNDLKKMKLENAYRNQSEFVRTIQIIMGKMGYNAMHEYIFSENGIERLCLIAGKKSSNFEERVRSQYLKNGASKNYIIETDYLKTLLAEIDLNDVTYTNLEMNSLLQNYLINNEKYVKNSKINEKLMDLCPEKVEYKKFYEENKNVNDEELKQCIEENISSYEFEYTASNVVYKNINVFIEKINKGYKNSQIKPTAFNCINLFAKMVCVTLYQNGIRTLTKEEMDKYINYMVFNFQSEKVLGQCIEFYFDQVVEKLDSGVRVDEIINKTLENEAFFEIKKDKIVAEITSENYWEKIDNIVDLLKEQNVNNKENFYMLFYQSLLKSTPKYFEEKRIYTQDDYEDFSNKMEKIYKKTGLPIELMNELGWTPDKLFIKSISDKLCVENRKEQIDELLKIVNNNYLVLGSRTNDLQDFALGIYLEYQKIENNKDERDKFIVPLVDSYYKTLKETMSAENRKISRLAKQENQLMDYTIRQYQADPESYEDPTIMKQLLDKYPNMYQKIHSNDAFKKGVMRDYPKELQERLEALEKQSNEDEIMITGMDLLKVSLGKSVPKPEEVTKEKISEYGKMAKFFLVYEVYRKIFDKDEAEKFWNQFYGEKEKTLYDVAFELTEKNPDEVNFQSLQNLTSVIKKECKMPELEAKDK